MITYVIVCYIITRYYETFIYIRIMRNINIIDITTTVDE